MALVLLAEGISSGQDTLADGPRLPAATPDQLTVTFTQYTLEAEQDPIGPQDSFTPAEFAVLLEKLKRNHKARQTSAISLRASEGIRAVVTLEQRLLMEQSVTVNGFGGRATSVHEVTIQTEVSVQWRKIEGKYRLEIAYQVTNPHDAATDGGVNAKFKYGALDSTVNLATRNSQWVQTAIEMEPDQVYRLAALGYDDRKIDLLTLRATLPK